MQIIMSDLSVIEAFMICLDKTKWTLNFRSLVGEELDQGWQIWKSLGTSKNSLVLNLYVLESQLPWSDIHIFQDSCQGIAVHHSPWSVIKSIVLTG